MSRVGLLLITVRGLLLYSYNNVSGIKTLNGRYQSNHVALALFERFEGDTVHFVEDASIFGETIDSLSRFFQTVALSEREFDSLNSGEIAAAGFWPWGVITALFDSHRGEEFPARSAFYVAG